MDRNKFKRIIAAIILIAGSFYTQAQNPPHPNGGGAPGSGNTVVGGQQGGAPIGSGNFLLLGLALLYATKKVRESRKEQAALQDME
jgi:hypothetical protein